MKKIVMILLLLFFFSLTNGQKSPIITTKNISSNKNSSKVDFDKSSQNKESDNIMDFKIWVPSVTALLVLFITNLVTLYKIRRDTKESIKKEVTVIYLKNQRDKLEKFYDPIFALLKSNASIFNAYGPNTFPHDSGPLETEAAMIWSKIVKDVIIPNNKRICETIYEFSHLVIKSDTITSYLDFIIHAESFSHFIENPNTLHRAFKYPNDFLKNVEDYRNEIIENLNVIEKKLVAIWE